MDLDNFLKELITALTGSFLIIFLFIHAHGISSCVRQFSS